MSADLFDADDEAATCVLLIGDNGRLENAAQRLRHRGYAIERASDLAAAVPRLRSKGLAAAVLSVGQGQGALAFEVCQTFARQRTSVILLYAGRDPSFAIRALEVGADDVLQEPANPIELVARIGAAVRRRRQVARALRRDDLPPINSTDGALA